MSSNLHAKYGLYFCYECGELTKPCKRTKWVMKRFNLGDLDIEIRCQPCKDKEYLKLSCWLAAKERR